MTTSPAINPIEVLITLLPNLSGWPASFGASVLEQVRRGRTLSDKQMFHVRKIVADASRPPAPAPRADVGDASAVIALFDRFAQRKRNPAVVLVLESHAGPDGQTVIDEEVRISRYGAQSKNAGQIKIASHTHFEDGTYGPRGVWYGTIGTNGMLSGSRKHAHRIERIAAVMSAFVAAPAEIAARDGRLMARCCFCYKSLSLEDSAGVGYGRKCAQNHGMPYGAAATRQALAEDFRAEEVA